jgi:hypothetical protein
MKSPKNIYLKFTAKQAYQQAKNLFSKEQKFDA